MNIGEIVKINIILDDENSFIYGIIINLSKKSFNTNTIKVLENHSNRISFGKLLAIDNEYDFYSHQLMSISEEEIKRLQKIVVFS